MERYYLRESQLVVVNKEFLGLKLRVKTIITISHSHLFEFLFTARASPFIVERRVGVPEEEGLSWGQCRWVF